MGAARVQLRDVDVHASVVGPVVRECDNEANPVLLCSIDDRVEP